MTGSERDDGRNRDEKTTAVNMMGAVSPAARPIERIAPVMIPGIAGGSTTRDMVCHGGGTQSKAAFPEGGGYSPPERLFGRPDDGREDHQGKCDLPGNEADAEVEVYDEEREAEEAEYDGRGCRLRGPHPTG